MLRAFQLAMATVLLASSALAQLHAGGVSPGTLSHIAPHPFATAHSHRHFYPGYGYYTPPYFYSDYEPYEDYVLEPPPRPEPTPQVKIEPAADPVLLELHGSQWVKVTNFSEPSKSAVSTGSRAHQLSTKPLPPAILVFHDGHTAEVTSYSIIGDSIHAKSDYWTTGEWNQTIPISALNIPATLEQNRERGLNFQLPSSPDEIMLRP